MLGDELSWQVQGSTNYCAVGFESCYLWSANSLDDVTAVGLKVYSHDATDREHWFIVCERILTDSYKFLLRPLVLLGLFNPAPWCHLMPQISLIRQLNQRPRKAVEQSDVNSPFQIRKSAWGLCCKVDLQDRQFEIPCPVWTKFKCAPSGRPTMLVLPWGIEDLFSNHAGALFRHTFRYVFVVQAAGTGTDSLMLPPSHLRLAWNTQDGWLKKVGYRISHDDFSTFKDSTCWNCGPIAWKTQVDKFRCVETNIERRLRTGADSWGKSFKGFGPWGAQQESGW